MLKRLLFLKNSIISYWNHKNKAPILSQHDFVLVSDLIKILAPLEEMTNTLSGSKYPTASMVIPMLNCTLKTLSKMYLKVQEEEELIPENTEEEDPYQLLDEESKRLSDLLIGILNTRFKSEELKKRPFQYDVESNLVLQTATALDCRFKKRYFDKENNSLHAQTSIELSLDKNSVQESSSIETNPVKPKKVSIWDQADDYKESTE